MTMAMQEGIFTATMSYHNMLKRAQALSPVLTYVVCKLLYDIDLEKQKHAFAQSPQVEQHPSQHPFCSYFLFGQMKNFANEVFSGLVVLVNDVQHCRDELPYISYYSLAAHRQFVAWLKQLPRLEFNDTNYEVIIPT